MNIQDVAPDDIFAGKTKHVSVASAVNSIGSLELYEDGLFHNASGISTGRARDYMIFDIDGISTRALMNLWLAETIKKCGFVVPR